MDEYVGTALGTELAMGVRRGNIVRQQTAIEVKLVASADNVC
jgi:hypothetical protein